jgi:hypothetical protein
MSIITATIINVLVKFALFIIFPFTTPVHQLITVLGEGNSGRFNSRGGNKLMHVLKSAFSTLKKSPKCCLMKRGSAPR